MGVCYLGLTYGGVTASICVNNTGTIVSAAVYIVSGTVYILTYFLFT